METQVRKAQRLSQWQSQTVYPLAHMLAGELARLHVSTHGPQVGSSRTSFTGLQTRLSAQYEWVSVSCSVVSDSFATPWAAACQGSSVHGILQAIILEWIAIPFSRGSSQPGVELRSPALQPDFLLPEPPGKSQYRGSQSPHLLLHDISSKVSPQKGKLYVRLLCRA